MPIIVLIVGGLIVCGMLACIVVAAVVLLGRRSSAPSEPPASTLDVSTLVHRDISALTRLEVYNLPMQLAAVIAAPAGRGAELPELNDLAQALDSLSPGLAGVFQNHAPKLVVWPAQLSSEGFVRSFFRHVALPGDSGKGSEWCSLAGRIEGTGQSLLVGLVCRSDKPNSLGQILVERSSKWLDIVRVRSD